MKLKFLKKFHILNLRIFCNYMQCNVMMMFYMNFREEKVNLKRRSERGRRSLEEEHNLTNGPCSE